MAERKKNTHVVFKQEDVSKYLSGDQVINLTRICEAIKRGRAADDKNPTPEYIICNSDEPYADKVLQTILEGEDEKLRKLELINSMEIIDFSFDGDVIEYISVEDNEENREILRKIGLTDEQIENECYPQSGELDITNAAFVYAGAKLFYSTTKDFSLTT